MVGAVVPELELERLRAEREPEDLVTEADAEHGHLAEEAGDGVGRAGDSSRVARPVGQEHPVGPAGEHVGGGGRGRHDLDVAAHPGEVAQDRRLDAEVVRDDVKRARLNVRELRELHEVHILIRILIRFLDRNGAGEIPSDHLRRLLHFLHK